MRREPAGDRAPPAGWQPRFLLVRLSALGDVVHALPALVALRRAEPHARIDWAVEDRFRDLVAPRAEVDRAVVLPRRALSRARGHPGARLALLRAFLARLRERTYDVAIDLQGNLKSGVVVRAARARRRVGFTRPTAREGNALLTDERFDPPAGAPHRVERALGLVAAALDRPLPWADPGLPVRPGAARRAEAAFAAAGLAGKRVVLLLPGTSAFGRFKRWPPDRFSDLARRLVAGGRAVGVLAPPGEGPLARHVARGAEGAVPVLPAPDLATLGELLRRGALVVGADTGPLHLAALAGVPTLALFGPKDAAVYAPYGRRADGTAGVLETLSRSDVACRPCRLRACAAPVCMTGLEPAAVAAVARSLLAPV